MLAMLLIQPQSRSWTREVKAALAEDGVSALSADGADTAGTDTSEAAEPDYGFAALDIHFEDANGNEVEPNGNVYVSIDAAGAAAGRRRS